MCDVILLAGGKGTRLASILPETPKPLAPVAGRPFLDYLLDFLARAGIADRLVVTLCHLPQPFCAYFNARVFPFKVSLVIEETPLGTGGALLNAVSATASDTVLVLNGDSFLNIDYPDLLRHHQHSGAPVTMALVGVEEASRYGSALVEGDKVTGFVEKQPGSGLINAGVYVIERRLLTPAHHPGPLSLERDLLPLWILQGLVAAYRTQASFLDIGVPAAYAQADRFLAGLPAACFTKD